MCFIDLFFNFMFEFQVKLIFSNFFYVKLEYLWYFLIIKDVQARFSVTDALNNAICFPADNFVIPVPELSRVLRFISEFCIRFILFEFCLRNGSLVFFLDLYYFLWVCWKDKGFCYKFDVFETTGQGQVNCAFATVAYHCRLLSEVSVSGDKKVMTVNNVFRCETHSTIVSISLPYFVSATEVPY